MNVAGWAKRGEAKPSRGCGCSGSVMSARGCPRLAEELAHQIRHRGGLLEMRRVSRPLHALDPGARDLPRELFRVDGWGNPILRAPDEQGGRLHAVDALLEALVRDGPDELARGTHGPREADLGGDALRLVLRLGEEELRAGARGIVEDVALHFLLIQHHPVGDGGIVAPEADGTDESQAAGAARIGGGQLAGDHGAEGVAHQGCVLDAHLLQQLVVAENEVPETVQVMDVVGSAGGGAGMLRSVHGEVLGQRVQERIPMEAPGAVKEDQGGALALRPYTHADAVLPDGEGAGVGAVESAHRALAAWVDSKRARSFSGHQ